MGLPRAGSIVSSIQVLQMSANLIPFRFNAVLDAWLKKKEYVNLSVRLQDPYNPGLVICCQSGKTTFRVTWMNGKIKNSISGIMPISKDLKFVDRKVGRVRAPPSATVDN